jgi:hypothetical protein
MESLWAAVCPAFKAIENQPAARSSSADVADSRLPSRQEGSLFKGALAFP